MQNGLDEGQDIGIWMSSENQSDSGQRQGQMPHAHSKVPVIIVP